MPNMQFNADLFRIAMRFASNEETRYYLKGIFIEPTPGATKGLRLVATNGHALFCAYDPNGTADSTGIVALSDAALKQCKTPKRELPRQIVVTGDTATVMRESETIAISEKCLIDGTYPDYRRVIPKMTDNPVTGVYAGKYLESFAWAAKELNPTGDGIARIKIVAEDVKSPALVFMPLPSGGYKTSRAFGILMPVLTESPVDWPSWAFVAPTGGPNSEYIEAVAS